MTSTYGQRQRIAKDTLERTEEIVKITPGASLDSVFITEQLNPLESQKSPGFERAVVRVVNDDAYTTAREILRRDPTALGKTTVLNLASDIFRAGGWLHALSKTQEEALCYTSTLFETLKQEYYPWPNLGPGCVAGVYSPAIVVFKDDLDHDCVDLPVEERVIVSVITVAAPRDPQLFRKGTEFLNPQDLEDFRGKIRLVYRMAAHNGQTHLVLGAMGCGAYLCPPRLVATEMKAILQEDEFRGWFKEIVFAVYSTAKNPNFSIFKETIDGILI